MFVTFFPLLVAAAQAIDPLAPAPAPNVESLAEEDCQAHRFEAIVTAEVDGKPRRTRVKLCGKKGQNDSQFLVTLKDSAAKIAASDQIPGPLRSEMVKAVTEEVARLERLLVASSASKGTKTEKMTPPPSLTLKPRGQITKAEDVAEYNNMPPLPTPPKAAEASLVPAKPLKPLVRPNVAFTCFAGGGVGEMPCTDFDRNTILVATAKSDVVAGSSIAFRLSGRNMIEIPLGAVRKGRSAKVPLPGEVCKGSNGGALEIEVMARPVGGGPARVADTIGPYTLRC